MQGEADEMIAIDLIEKHQNNEEKYAAREVDGLAIPKLTAFFIIAFTWLSIFALIAIARPVYNVGRQIVSSISVVLAVDPTVVIIGAGFSLYVTFAVILVSNPQSRAVLKRIGGLTLKRETSFYPALKRGELPGAIRGGLSLSSGVADLLSALLKPSENRTDGKPTSQNDHLSEEALLKKTIVDKVASEVTDELSKEFDRYQLRTISDRSLSRLSNQTEVLGSRANLTLWMGIGFCSVGLIALWFSFFSSSAAPISLAAAGLEWVELAKSYGPRLTLVILIEVIGFFFLKMYRATLSEIRYVQNEITNVEMRILGLNAALSDSMETLPSIIDYLSKTERNSVIEKGQTTVEIERERATAKADRSILDAVASLLHGNEKASFWRKSGK